MDFEIFAETGDTTPWTPEQIEAEAEYTKELDEVYKRYSDLRHAYEQIIPLEEDPIRKRMLNAFLEDLNEENK
jgi:hypothetical protein